MIKIVQNTHEDFLATALTTLEAQGYSMTSFTSCARNLDEIMHTAVLSAGDATVTYNGNTPTSGTAPTDTRHYAVGSAAIVQGAANLVKTNKIFGGWNTLANGTGTTYQPGAAITLAGDTTLYALWVTAYTVTYNGNTSSGGTAPTDAAKYVAEGVAIVRAPGTLVKTGKIFSGWNTLANGEGEDYAPGEGLVIAANTTLYAVWVDE